MRIIAGKHRGRALAQFAGNDVRPTPDRVKESVFQIIGANLVGARVLDLFCGSGALGLESVDLSALQNLEYLTINGNALTSLDLSANTALKTLYCFGNSELASIILPAGITDLQCYGCALTSLDVSACTGLTRLSCHTNQITALDLSHNPALQTLICSSLPGTATE